MAFGNQAVGTTSAPLTLTLTNIGSETVNVSAAANSNTADFAITANTCTTLTQATSCSITLTFHPTATGARYATVTVTSDGLYSPQAFTFTGTGTPAGLLNYEGIWWNSGESGWGINFEHQGNTIFATWFTYDTAGKAWWLVMTADGGPGNTFTGTAVQDDRFVVSGQARSLQARRPRSAPARSRSPMQATRRSNRRQRHASDEGDHAAGLWRAAHVHVQRLAESRRRQELPGTLVERDRIRLGYQFRAPGQYDLRDLVHVRRRRLAVVARRDNGQRRRRDV